MTCGEIHPLLSPSLDEALDAVDEAALHLHLADCASCSARLERLRASRDAFRLAAPPRGRRHATQRRSTRAVAARTATAAVLGLVMLVAVLTRTHVREPRDVTINELAVMELPQVNDGSLPPCYRAADCGLETLVP